MFALSTFLAACQTACSFIPGAAPRPFATVLRSTQSLQKQSKTVNPTSYEGSQKDELDQATKGEPPSSLIPDVLFPVNEVFKGIHLPSWDPSQGHGLLGDFTLSQVAEFLGGADAPSKALVGQPKGSLDSLREVVAKVANYDETVPSPDDYQFWGNGDYEKQLTLLLKTNPFMAATLTESRDGGFELKAFDRGERKPSLFLKTMRTFNGEGHRVNFKFDSKMNIESFQVFDDRTGKELKVDSHDRKKYASSAIFNIFYFASSVHATIHVFHFLLTSAMVEATKDFDAMHKLALAYSRNVRNKYIQVGQLLITDPAADPANDSSLITGMHGIGGSQAVRPILEELLNSWGETSTATHFFRDMMNVSEQKMDKAGILVEFRKHLDLVQPFSIDIRRSLQRIDSSKYNDAQRNLNEYLDNCGSFKSNINSVQSWFEMMSVTGIVHGATLSYTRLVADPGVVRWRNIGSDKWDPYDVNLIVGVLGTICGMEEGRHVMGNEVDGEVFENNIQDVLNEYEGRASTLKEAYKEALLAGDKGEFNNFGFILTDYGPDNFDGKQLTITTYI